MLSGVAWRFLKPVLEEYFKDLDEASLKINLLGGNAVLSNLFLHENVLIDNLDLPLHIVEGIVGTMKISIDWKAPLSNPINVVLDDVTILVKLTDVKPHDEEEEKKKAKEKRRKQLEELNKSSEEDQKSASAADDLFSSKSLFSVINNLQVEIKNIHIRYEDDGSITGCEPFSGGVVLESIFIDSANGSWEKSTKKLSKIIARKLVAMKGFGVYVQCDEVEKLLSKHSKDTEKLRKVMQSLTHKSNVESDSHLLNPLSFSSKLSINKKVKNKDGTHPPQFEVDVHLPHLGLGISRKQFVNVLQTSAYFEHLKNKQEHRRGRPTVPVSGNARVWWQFAVLEASRQFREKKRKLTWEFFAERRDNRKEYISLHMKCLEGKSLSSVEKKKLQRLEEEVLSMNDIQLYRKIAKSRVPKAKTVMQNLSSWWFGGSASKAEEETKKELEESEMELRRMLAQEEDYEQPKDAEYVGTVVNLVLKELSFRMVDDSDGKAAQHVLLSTMTENTHVSVHQRPVSSGLDFSVAIGSNSCMAYCPEKDVMFPLLQSTVAQPRQHFLQHSSISSQTKRLEKQPACLELFFSSNPLQDSSKAKIDSRVGLSVFRHIVEVRAEALARIARLVTVPKEVHSATVAYVALQSYELANKQVATGMAFAIDEHKNLDLHVNITAPLIKVVSPSRAEEDMVLVDLGSLCVESEIASPLQDGISAEELENLSYDKYDVKLTGTKVAVVPASMDVNANPSQNQCIIDNIPVSIFLQRCILQNQLNLPEVKVDVKLGCVEVSVSDRHMIFLSKTGKEFGDAFTPNEEDHHAQDKYEWFMREMKALENETENEISVTAIDSTEVGEKQEENFTDYDDVDDELDDDADEDNEDDDNDDDDVFMTPPSTPTIRMFDNAQEVMEKKKSASQVKKLVLDLLLEKFNLSLCKAEEGKKMVLVKAEILNTHANIVQRLFDTSVSANLSGIAISTEVRGVKDYFLYTRESVIESETLPSNDEVQTMLTSSSSPNGGQFVNVNLTLCDPKHPSFQKDFNSTKTKVDLLLSRVGIHLEQSWFIPFIETCLPFMDNLVSSLQGTIQETSSNTAMPLQRQSQQPSTPSQENVTSLNRLESVVEVAAMLNFSGIELAVAKDEHILFVISQRTVDVSAEICGKQTKIDMGVKSLYLRQFCVSDSLYPLVIQTSVSHKKKLTMDKLLHVILHMRDDPSPEEIPLSLFVKMASLQVTLESTFMKSLIQFAHPIVGAMNNVVADMKQKHQDSPHNIEITTTTTTASTSTTDATHSTPSQDVVHNSLSTPPLSATTSTTSPKSNRFFVDIDVLAPVIVIPLEHNSQGSVVVNLGNIAITNAILSVASSSSERTQIQGPVFKLYTAYQLVLSDLEIGRSNSIPAQEMSHRPTKLMEIDQSLLFFRRCQVHALTFAEESSSRSDAESNSYCHRSNIKSSSADAANDDDCNMFKVPSILRPSTPFVRNKDAPTTSSTPTPLTNHFEICTQSHFDADTIVDVEIAPAALEVSQDDVRFFLALLKTAEMLGKELEQIGAESLFDSLAESVDEDQLGSENASPELAPCDVATLHTSSSLSFSLNWVELSINFYNSSISPSSKLVKPLLAPHSQKDSFAAVFCKGLCVQFGSCERRPVEINTQITLDELKVVNLEKNGLEMYQDIVSVVSVGHVDSPKGDVETHGTVGHKSSFHYNSTQSPLSLTYSTERNTVLLQIVANDKEKMPNPEISIEEVRLALQTTVSHPILACYAQQNAHSGTAASFLEFESSDHALTSLGPLTSYCEKKNEGYEGTATISAKLGTSMQSIVNCHLHGCTASVSPAFLSNTLVFLKCLDEESNQYLQLGKEEQIETEIKQGIPENKVTLSSESVFSTHTFGGLGDAMLPEEELVDDDESDRDEIIDEDDVGDVDSEFSDGGIPSPFHKRKCSYDETEDETEDDGFVKIASLRKQVTSTSTSVNGNGDLRAVVYVKNIFNPDSKLRSLPTPTHDLSFKLGVHSPTFVLVEDVSKETSRNINLSCILTVSVIVCEKRTVITSKLKDLTAVSKIGMDRSSQLEIISPTTVTVQMQANQDNMTVILSSSHSVNLNVTYSDIMSLSRSIAHLSQHMGDDAIKSSSAVFKAWTQRPKRISTRAMRAVETPADVVVGKVLSPSQASASEEKLILTKLCFNVYFIDTHKRMRTPLLCVSASVEGNAQNWSSGLLMEVTTELAVASFEPRYASWEPLALGSSSMDGKPAPYTLGLRLITPLAGDVDLGRVKIASCSLNRNVTCEGGVLGGHARNMLDPSNKSMWYCIKQKKHYVVFDLGQNEQLQRFFYRTKGNCVHRQPRVSTLSVGDTPSGPWRPVTTMKVDRLTQDDNEKFWSQMFKAWGRYWRWDILEKTSDVGAFILHVGFEKSVSGRVVELEAEDFLNLTITSNGVERLSSVTTTWMKDFNEPLGASEEEDGEERAMRAGQVGTQIATHRLVNSTYNPLAFTPCGDYDASLASHYVVPEQGVCVFEPEPRTLTKYNNPDTQSFTDYVRNSERAVRDLYVIDVTEREVAPPGFHVIEKNLNEGSKGGHVMYLCVSWEGNKAPITDIHVAYVGTKGCGGAVIGISEPIPKGYTLVDVNLNKGAKGNFGIPEKPRDVYISVHRGNGPPIQDVVVVCIDSIKREIPPSGYTLIRRDLSRGIRGDRVWPFLCIKRAPCRWTRQVVKTIGQEIPITDLLVMQTNGKEVPTPPARGSWDCLKINGKPVNLNEKTGGLKTYLFQSRLPNKKPLTAISLQRKASGAMSADWSFLRPNVNINDGNKCRDLSICTCREIGGRPIVDIQLVYGNHCPEGYNVVWPHLNWYYKGMHGSDSLALYICYRTADPLLGEAVLLDEGEDQVQMKKGDKTQKKNTKKERGASQRSKNVMVERRREREMDAKQQAFSLHAINLLQNSSDSVFAIGMELRDYKPIERVNITNVGEATYLLTSSTPSSHDPNHFKQVRVVVDVFVKNNIKYVVIRSPLSFHNQLREPIDLGLHLKRDEASWEAVVKPNEIVSPPLGVMDEINEDGELVPLYKFFNTVTKCHFYTVSPILAAKNSPWNVEVCVLGYLFRSQQRGMVPLYATSANHFGQQVFVNQSGVKVKGWELEKGADMFSDDTLREKGAVFLGFVKKNAGNDPEWTNIYFLYDKTKDDYLLVNTLVQERANPKFALVSTKGLIRIKPSRENTYSVTDANFQYPGKPLSLTLRWEKSGGRKLSSVSSDEKVHSGKSFNLSSAHSYLSSSFDLSTPVTYNNGLPCTVVLGLVANGNDLPYAYFALKPNRHGGFMTLSSKSCLLRIAIIGEDLSIPSKETSNRVTPHNIPLESWSDMCTINLRNSKVNKYKVRLSGTGKQGAAPELIVHLKLSFKFGGEGPAELFLFSPFEIVDRTAKHAQLRAKNTDKTFLMTTVECNDEVHKPGYNGCLKGSMEHKETAPPKIGLFNPSEGVQNTVVRLENFVSDTFDVNKLEQFTQVRLYRVSQPHQRDDYAKKSEEESFTCVLRWMLVGEKLLTKRLFVDPILVFNNNTKQEFVLIYQRSKQVRPIATKLKAGGCSHSFFTPLCDKSLWCIKDPNSEAKSCWFSPTFLEAEQKKTYVLKLTSSDEDFVVAVDVSCMVFQRRFIVTVNSSPKPPMRVENYSKCAIGFRQKGRNKEQYFVKSQHSQNYAFDNLGPHAPEVLEIQAVDLNRMENNAQSTEVGIAPDTIQSLPLPLNMGSGVIYVNVVNDTTTGYLRFIIADSPECLRRVFGLSDSIPEEHMVLNARFQFPGITASVVHKLDELDAIPKEFILLSVLSIEGSFSQSSESHGFAVSVMSMQLDFQQNEALYKSVIFDPSKLGSKPSDQPLVILSFLMRSKQIGRGRASDWIEYFGLRVLPFSVMVDGEFLQHLLNVMSMLHLLPDGSSSVPPEPSPWPMYFKTIVISPIKVFVTLQNISPVLEHFPTILKSFGVTLVNLDGVIMHLESVEVNGLLATSNGVSASLLVNFKQKFMGWLKGKGIVSLALSLDVLGDPLEAIRGVAYGLKSLVYEPFDAVMVGPKEFGELVGKGAKELGLGVVGATFGSTSKVTSTLAKGFATASGDDDFKRQRERELLQKPKNAGEGLVSGFKMFGKSVLSGFTGVVTTPLKEGEKGGFVGGLKGVGKGVFGLIAKPVGGVLDMTSQTIAGVHMSISGTDASNPIPMRLPRHVSPFGQIVPFSTHAAQGLFLLHTLKKKHQQLSSSPYISHVEFVQGKISLVYFFLVDRVIVVDVKELNIVANYDATEIAGFSRSARGDGVEMLFVGGSAARLKLSHPSLFPKVCRSLRVIIDIHYQGTLLSASTDTVFQAGKLQSVVVEMYEYERFRGGRWGKQFYATDPFDCFQDVGSGETYTVLEEVPLKKGWKWVNEWKWYNLTGSEGWEYAVGLDHPFTEVETDANIRRRVWKRTQEGLSGDDVEHSVSLERGIGDDDEDDDEEEEGN
eukprot:m.223801 g.223801  ORF g.223801 m.223801 type:complete len:4453 (+) comp13852_c0_seq3:78-13436(+)